MKEHPFKTFISAFAVIATFVVAISYGTLTSYYAGYLRYFEVDIQSIGFWPQLSDFLIIASGAILGILIATGLGLPLLLIANIIAKKLKNSEKKGVQEIGDSLQLSKQWIIGIVLSTLAILAFSLIYVQSEKNGFKAASEKSNFTNLTTTKNSNEILIYQSNGTGIIKTYDENSKKFNDGYRTIELVNQSFDQVLLKR